LLRTRRSAVPSSIDRFGRRPLLLIGSVGMAVTLGALAVIFGTAPVEGGQPHLSGAAGPIALVAANLYVFAFGMSWGPVVWVMLGEKFPNRIRAAALGVARRAVDRQLADFHDLPCPQRHRARPGQWHLHRRGHPVVLLRHPVRVRDQGQGIGGDAHLTVRPVAARSLRTAGSTTRRSLGALLGPAQLLRPR
jgi:hypothetical protein